MRKDCSEENRAWFVLYGYGIRVCGNQNNWYDEYPYVEFVDARAMDKAKEYAKELGIEITPPYLRNGMQFVVNPRGFGRPFTFRDFRKVADAVKTEMDLYEINHGKKWSLYE